MNRAAAKDPENLDAWDSFLRGLWLAGRPSSTDGAEARSFFERAIELDPQFQQAYYTLALSHFIDLLYQRTDTPFRSIQELGKAARKCVELDARRPIAHMAMGCYYGATGDRERAIRAFEQAIELNPAMLGAYFFLGVFLSVVGRPEEGIANLEQAIRLSPKDVVLDAGLPWAMALAHFVAERYEAAVEWAQRSLQKRPEFAWALAILAASYAQLGRTAEARAALETQPLPTASPAALRLALAAGDPDFVERFLDVLVPIVLDP